MFFELSSWVLALIILATLLGATAAGLAVGHRARAHANHVSEPFAVLQAVSSGCGWVPAGSGHYLGRPRSAHRLDWMKCPYRATGRFMPSG